MTITNHVLALFGSATSRHNMRWEQQQNAWA
jgi:hypothetical protein